MVFARRTGGYLSSPQNCFKKNLLFADCTVIVLPKLLCFAMRLIKSSARLCQVTRTVDQYEQAAENALLSTSESTRAVHFHLFRAHTTKFSQRCLPLQEKKLRNELLPLFPNTLQFQWANAAGKLFNMFEKCNQRLKRSKRRESEKIQVKLYVRL